MNIIKKARKEKGLTRREVAEYLDLPIWIYNEYEKNINVVDFAHLIKLSLMLEFEIKV